MGNRFYKGRTLANQTVPPAENIKRSSRPSRNMCLVVAVAAVLIAGMIVALFYPAEVVEFCMRVSL